MPILKLSAIVVPEGRQRQTFDQKSIDVLAKSIEDLGQLNAIVLEDDGRTLRAGERRLRAITQLAAAETPFYYNGSLVQPGHIACTFLHELTPEQKFRVELEENTTREDLTWQERVQAYAALDDLYKKRCEAEGKPFKPVDLAREVRGPDDIGRIKAFTEAHRESVSIARHLDDPEVAAAKSRKEADKIVRRKQTLELQRELQRRIAEKGNAGEVTSPHVLFHGDAFDIVPDFTDGYFDIIVTDPPYGIDMDKMGTQSGSSSGHTHNYSDSETYAADCVRLVAKEGFRITRSSAHCYMFCDMRHFYKWKDLFETYGWYVWPNPIIWDKRPTGSLLGEANGPRHVYEVILYAIKGRKGVNTVIEDIITVPGPSRDKRHPAEKPVELLGKLLSASATPGDKLLDMFGGCGALFPAATRFQCFATVLEKDADHHATAALRKDDMTEIM